MNRVQPRNIHPLTIRATLCTLSALIKSSATTIFVLVYWPCSLHTGMPYLMFLMHVHRSWVHITPDLPGSQLGSRWTKKYNEIFSTRVYWFIMKAFLVSFPLCTSESHGLLIKLSVERNKEKKKERQYIRSSHIFINKYFLWK